MVEALGRVKFNLLLQFQHSCFIAQSRCIDRNLLDDCATQSGPAERLKVRAFSLIAKHNAIKNESVY
jgi:hypothetical protein